MSTQLQIPSLRARALITGDSWNPSTGDLRLEFGSEAESLQFDDYGDPFDEVLSFDPEHVRLERLNTAGSVLDSHGRSENRFGSVPLDHRLGGVLRAWAEGGRGLADIQLLLTDRTADVRAAFDQGIPPGVSVGYRVFAYRDITGPEDVRRKLLAVDWEPFEITLTPVPDDHSLRYRSAEPSATNLCTIEDMSQPAKKPKTDTKRTEGAGDPAPPEPKLAERVRSLLTETPGLFSASEIDTLAESLSVEAARSLVAARVDAAATPPADPATDEPADRKPDPVAAERARSHGIHELAARHNLPATFTSKHINEGTTLDRVRALVLDSLNGDQDNDTMNPNHRTAATVGEEEGTKRLAAMGRALEHRMGVREETDKGLGGIVKLDDGARHFRSMSLLGVAQGCLSIRGDRPEQMSQEQLLGRALGMGTSDFPQLLSNSANKLLHQAYAAKEQRWRRFAQRGDARDFKPMTRHQLGDAPSLKPLGENGEVELGQMSEAVESYSVQTQARRVALTRTAIINDDLGAFSRLITKGGQAARRREDAIVWNLITSNPTMNDGVAVFHADHGNLGSGVINVTNIGAGVQAMMDQTGVANAAGEADILEVEPSFLVVPTSKVTVAKQFVNTMLQPASQSDVNPYQDLEVIPSAYLEAADSAAWYLVAAPTEFDFIEYAYLNGMEGPQLITQENTDNMLGIQYTFYTDFGAGVLDFRGAYKSSGS